MRCSTTAPAVLGFGVDGLLVWEGLALVSGRRCVLVGVDGTAAGFSWVCHRGGGVVCVDVVGV